MIIKILSRKSPSFIQLLHYIFEGDERVPHTQAITHNVKGQTIPEWIQEFEVNESYRKRKRKNSTILTHEILSWSTKDAPTIAIMEDICRKYIQERNPAGMYVGAIHSSKDHYHVHFCVSGVAYRSGEPLRLSKHRFKKVKLEVEQYQQIHYPELSHSRVNHNPRTRSDTHRTYWIKKRGTTPTKEIVSNTLQKCFQSASDVPSFLGELEVHGLIPYYRKGKLAGVWFGGRKYRFSRLGLELQKLSPSINH